VSYDGRLMTELATSPFFLDEQQLRAIARERAADYRSAFPCPNTVIDDFLPPEVATAAAEEFAGLDTEGWQLYTDSGNTLKLATSDEFRMGPLLRQLVAQFNSHAFIEFLETLTGIVGLVADPHIHGGGLHQLNPGGFLNVHADFNWHERIKLDRRINVLLYLNPGWKEEWGGAFELWTPDMERCVVKVPPILNRMAIFNTTSTSFHGNPDPVACPEGNARRSLAFYYYTNGRPEEERRAAHSTLYQAAGELPEDVERPHAPPRWRRIARELAPPAAVKAARRLRRR
jgi:2-oxoglutarate-Fe(II)-dependent oxygenase superfamily protein